MVCVDHHQGVEVTVNASSLEDIDPSAIGQRLTNGTAAVASPVLSRLRTRDEDHGDVVRLLQSETVLLVVSKTKDSQLCSLLCFSSIFLL